MAEAIKPARDATWDIARGIGMMLVIYGHLLEPVLTANPAIGRPQINSAVVQWQIMYSFHMMLFFLVSGAVNRNLTKKAWPDALRGSLRLLTLTWLVHILGCVFAMSAGFAPPEATGSVWGAAVYIVDPILEGYCWSIGVVWFLTSLCFVQLLAYVLLRYIPALIVVLLGVAGTVAVVYFDAPNQFLFRTWAPGLTFFAIGYQFSQWQVRWRFWYCIPLFAAIIVLGPINHGCSFSFSGPCQVYGSGPFAIRIFGGSYGFLPLFFVTSLLGSVAVVCLSKGLARFRASELFAYAGRRSLDLFIINGFVATFLTGIISANFPWSYMTAPLYVSIPFFMAMAIGMNAAHLIVLQAVRRALAALDNTAVAMANAIVGLVAREKEAAARAA